jgi:hypothetical protein
MAQKKVIAFFTGNFGVRGTDDSVYNYAYYNKTILGNESIIFCFSAKKIMEKGDKPLYDSYDKYKSQFPIYTFDDYKEARAVILEKSVDFVYFQLFGISDPPFFDKSIYAGTKCKTIKHDVFVTKWPEGDYHISISHSINRRFGTNVPVIPYIVKIPDHPPSDNYRKLMHIPEDAIVFGRHGGIETFDIPYVHQIIREFMSMPESANVYFVFMNTERFFNHPRVIYMNASIDIGVKMRFIHTCDIMIHARQIGETFGLAVAEFSSANKPVVTCYCGDTEHIDILREKAIIYRTPAELMEIFKSVRHIIKSRDSWNAYEQFTPERVMAMFNDLFNQ